ncbi:hypothetical protein TNCV_1904001 [Trichonephila clavipes]|nr:hypothetical protein TNCV_1904001 [Trichonephila clavipes]
MVLKAKANDRRKNLALSRDEFRGSSSDVTVDQFFVPENRQNQRNMLDGVLGCYTRMVDFRPMTHPRLPFPLKNSVCTSAKYRNGHCSRDREYVILVRLVLRAIDFGTDETEAIEANR